MGIFSALKTKVILLLGVLLGFAVLFIDVLQKNALKRKVQELELSSDAKARADKAMMEGLENEARIPVNRDYFGDK